MGPAAAGPSDLNYSVSSQSTSKLPLPYTNIFISRPESNNSNTAYEQEDDGASTPRNYIAAETGDELETIDPSKGLMTHIHVYIAHAVYR